ncbi:hypothetical protein Nepgr_005931 [Nepenthes gracilis]|uniref:Uncharacterized protein n=1 Tax=Nepenthes gracilis TaxID=150966 RepID=A0AAD3XGW7_NEPGR|nr:hypothetical protein Nepgr_005931 [Nepenthes gracilis]
MFNAQSSTSALSVAHDSVADQVEDDPAKALPAAKNGPSFGFDVPNGLDISAIVSFIEVDNHYRIKNNFRLKWTQSSLKDIRSRQSHGIAEHLTSETVEEAARCAAYKIAGAQNKSFKAAEAVKEAERIAVMAEESYSILQFAKDIFDKCTCSEVVLLA